MLFPPKPLDQILPNFVCELLTCMRCATAKKLALLPGSSGEGSKGQISFNFNYKVDLKDFYTNFVCVLTNKRYKTYQTEFLICNLGYAPGVGLWGAGGAQVAKHLSFSTWSCGISN